MNRSEVDRNKISPMMKQYLEIKDKYPDTLIFYRLGDFYEMFFEDAIVGNRELGLTLTGRNAGLDERVPMCGVPHHAYVSYLDKLVEKGYKVAICEQMEDPKLAKGMVDRDIVQIVTKGTRLDSDLYEKDNNFIGSLYDFNYCYIFTFADITTGSIYSMIIDNDKEKLIKEVTKRNIRELIVNEKIDRGIINEFREKYSVLVTIYDSLYEDNNYESIYKDINDLRIITGIKHLLSYVVENKKGDLSHLQKVEIINSDKYLLFDIHTKRNLELIETIRTKDRIYSLLWLLDKTKTAMGGRLLKYNIENPLTDESELNRRFNIIEKLLNEFILKEDLIRELSNVYDLERLIGRVAYGNLNARDLIQLKNSLKALPIIHNILEELEYDKNVETLDDLYSLLEESINEDAPVTLREG